MQSSSSQDPQTSAEQREWNSLPASEKKRKVNDLVRYLIFSSSQKIPVKRDELIRSVMDGRGKSFNLALDSANQTLEKVFGLTAVETKKGTQRVYILVNCLSSDTRNVFTKQTEKDLSCNGLLCVLLCFLMMKPQGTATEEHIWTLLNSLGIEEDSTAHPIFGSIKDRITTFLDQCYLEREKKVVGEATVFEYRWGSRAKVEVDKRELLTIMSEIHEDDFAIWERQFGDLLKDE